MQQSVKRHLLKLLFAACSLLAFLPFLIWTLWFSGAVLLSVMEYVQTGGHITHRVDYTSPYEGIFKLIAAYVSLIIGALVAKCYIVVAERNYIFGNTTLSDNVQVHSNVKLGAYLMLLFTNTLITLFSLGLAAPVAQVRYARFMANATQVSGDLSLLNVQAHSDTARSAVAEEAISALDLNVDI
ncbi:MAG: DUF898 family protein [Candidatus Symbiopectobacterium sp. PLON1]|nr:DUF898 family protein [Candidatus Symbiopectobacterium sp. PLON1]